MTSCPVSNLCTCSPLGSSSSSLHFCSDVGSAKSTETDKSWEVASSKSPCQGVAPALAWPEHGQRRASLTYTSSIFLPDLAVLSGGGGLASCSTKGLMDRSHAKSCGVPGFRMAIPDVAKSFPGLQRRGQCRTVAKKRQGLFVASAYHDPQHLRRSAFASQQVETLCEMFDR